MLALTEVPCPVFDAYYQKLNGQEELGQYFQMFGLDFGNSYPQIFDCLWSLLALHPSGSRMAEAFHGIERHAFNEQTHHGWTDARGRYLMLGNGWRTGIEKFCDVQTESIDGAHSSIDLG
mmetsp:Transcript_18474/g.44480  ORF Transcript_18474/g.44480 Transcript_18474/m.44480 type:complete len:120 (-) Transcript_18474:529-888(-)